MPPQSYVSNICLHPSPDPSASCLLCLSTPPPPPQPSLVLCLLYLSTPPNPLRLMSLLSVYTPSVVCLLCLSTPFPHPLSLRSLMSTPSHHRPLSLMSLMSVTPPPTPGPSYVSYVFLQPTNHPSAPSFLCLISVYAPSVLCLLCLSTPPPPQSYVCYVCLHPRPISLMSVMSVYTPPPQSYVCYVCLHHPAPSVLCLVCLSPHPFCPSPLLTPFYALLYPLIPSSLPSPNLSSVTSSFEICVRLNLFMFGFHLKSVSSCVSGTLCLLLRIILLVRAFILTTYLQDGRSGGWKQKPQP